jgi:hydrogenase nickel incorporation protein HypA/HybF
MHELALAEEVIRVAELEAEKYMATSVCEITIEVGNFSGVVPEALESALAMLTNRSVLEKAFVNIVKVKGKGVCHACNREFEMDQRIDTCPDCRSFPSEIRGGHEFRVVSIMIEHE